MDHRLRIQLLYQEGLIYQSHGLFLEAGIRYKETMGMIRRAQGVANRNELIRRLQRKFRHLKAEAMTARHIAGSARMSRVEESIVRNTFSTHETKSDQAALEIASALLGFGQFNTALQEFNSLLKKKGLRVIAAKNILRCQMAIASVNKAVRQYQVWLDSGRFPGQDLEKVRQFLEAVLRKKGSEVTLPSAEPQAEEPSPDPGKADTEDELRDIISIVIPVMAPTGSIREVPLEVCSHSGNIVSALLTEHDPEIVELLKAGAVFNDAAFFSPIAMFSQSCSLTGIHPIATGKKKGGFTLALKITRAPDRTP